ncbi:MAG: hypothetical protein LKH46_03190 [Pediococcus pentosaceus]|uniref:Uncharacterized protein n=1 Tax=Pediococcus pentosaceus TaxID=1255 RepID=A0A1Y0VMA5_PEDPE|nr:hypothetical protein [Pediococcus pentosaceus]AHA05967.1 hypothetical protein T256_06665 [Pediococcus pentosaceus SL4]ARW19305.1 hypothetical protein S100892_00716 [Pediococcus pentosaceus]KAF0522257.1 hypothetical protein GBP32_07460 [Pediococcus pentosaceus]MBF7124224.1 hypothetical protein [Pediococcus pentosaceus]MCD5257834.1 hypothetical protein [Pediococcus pentosaceus]
MKKIILLFIFMFALVTMAGCGTSNKVTKGSDFMIAYTDKGKKVVKITNYKGVHWVSNELGEAGGRKQAKLPSNAKRSYHYVMQQVKPKYKIYMDVYSNNDFVKISNIPVFGTVVCKMPAKVVDKLNHPQELE